MFRLISIVTIVGITLTCALAEEELYSDQYDHIDPQEILDNDKLRNQYYSCFMDTGPCVTSDAKFFKEIFGDAVASKCKKCTDKQKENMDTIVDWFTKNKPEEWQALVEKSLEDLKRKNGGQ